MQYTVGFMFDSNFKNVALIRKTKPKWQAGLMNGIGGKREEGEDHLDCIVREFKEETGHDTTREQWKHFAVMSGHDPSSFFQVECFATFGDLKKLKTMEEEEVVIFPVKDIHPLREDMVENLPWMISMAIDHLQDRRPLFANIKY